MNTADLQLPKTFADARDLAARFQKSQSFQQYVQSRMVLLVPGALVYLLISIACAAATVIFLAERHPLLALPGLLFAPVILVGSLFVQGYVLLGWLEDRALAQALGRRRVSRWGIDMGRMPRVPWVMAAIFVAAPLVLLAALTMPAALALIVLGAGAPVLFARLDRQP